LCFSVEKEQLWVWEYEDSDSLEKHEMLMDIGEKIRFKVRDEVFRDTSPAGPSRPEIAAEDRKKKVPYSIFGTCSEPGLGLVSWWK
jgi:DNA-directed RNA polymerase subunit E'/Rpb7